MEDSEFFSAPMLRGEVAVDGLFPIFCKIEGEDLHFIGPNNIAEIEDFLFLAAGPINDSINFLCENFFILLPVGIFQAILKKGLDIFGG